MGVFVIQPQRQEFARVYDNTFLWQEENIYVMANHRLALWCWLQCENILNREHVLIHIDEHTDARRWEGTGEPECLKEALSIFQNLKNFEVYESLQCPHRDPWTGRQTRPCITWDNFVHLAAKADMFAHYYIYSSVGDWNTGLPDNAFDFHRKMRDVYNIGAHIEKHAGRCVVDIDLDFFDWRNGFLKKTSEDELLIRVMRILADRRDAISMITISLNESPGDPLWEKRQHQLSIVKEILGMDVPIPIMTED